MPFYGTVMVDRTSQQAGDIFHRQGMIPLHGILKIIAIHRTDLVQNEALEFWSEGHRDCAALPGACFYRVRRSRCRVGRVDSGVPVPGRLEACEHSHDLDHDCPAVTHILPGPESFDDVRVYVVVGVGSENFIGRRSARGDQFIEKIIRRRAVVGDFVFCCTETTNLQQLSKLKSSGFFTVIGAQTQADRCHVRLTGRDYDTAFGMHFWQAPTPLRVRAQIHPAAPASSARSMLISGKARTPRAPPLRTPS